MVSKSLQVLAAATKHHYALFGVPQHIIHREDLYAFVNGVRDPQMKILLTCGEQMLDKALS
jgi:hypothetical protein